MAGCCCCGRRHRCCHGARRITCKQLGYGLLIALVAAILLTAAILLILRFAAVPSVNAKVIDARLNAFAFLPPTNNSFVFNVSVALAVRNPGGAGIKHTKPLVATFVFSDRRLGNADTAAEEGDTQKPLKTKVHVFRAAGTVSRETLGGAASEDLRKQMNATGVFRLELRVSGEIAYVGLDVIGNKRKVGFSCPLSLPVAPPGPEVVVFREVGCETQGPDKIYF